MILRKFFLDEEEPEVGERKVGLRLVKLAASRRHHFSPEKVAELESEGFATRSNDAITLHTVDGDMVLHIDHAPGRVCSHCAEDLTSEVAARAHVELAHQGIVSPDASHPAGYKMKNYYGVTADESVPTLNSEGLE